jgi:hypothetical protein
MNHKGQFDVARKTIFWMIAGFLIAIIILAFTFTIADYRSKLTYVLPQMKAEFITLRFANIPQCFAYKDDLTGRVYSSTIDLEKFTKERLFSCYHTEPKEGYQDFNFRLVLKNANKEIFTNNYFNKDDFTQFKRVLVKDGDSFKEDTLIVYVQQYISKPEVNPLQ